MMSIHGAVRDPGDFPGDCFGIQPKEQPGNGAARRGNLMYRLGSAAYHLQYYHRDSGRTNVAKQRGVSKIGAAPLLGRTLRITCKKKHVLGSIGLLQAYSRNYISLASLPTSLCFWQLPVTQAGLPLYLR